MTAIRNIKESEGEAFLQLLCDVFSLDFNRAYDVFFREPLFDLRRKWALFEGNDMISILTTTPLIFGWGRAIGVAGVATRKERQNEGHASRLLEKVFRESTLRGEGAALLFAKELGLYERNGFEAIDRVVRAPVITTAEPTVSDELPFEQVRSTYEKWSSGSTDRLRRDDLRWDYWKWHYRQSTPLGDGYICSENGTLREAILPCPQASLPLPSPTEWYGTALMADLLEIPFAGTPTVELFLMGRNVPGIPQLFMTDQF